MPIGTFVNAITVFFILYFLLINGTYLVVHTFALVFLHRNVEENRLQPAYEPKTSPFTPGIAILVPAYNEAPVIVSSIRSLLNLEYPDSEIVVINDGSTDETMDRLREAFDLQKLDAPYPVDLPCEPIRGVYAAAEADLVVLDKENGGKADALNAGVFFTDEPLFCAVDADTVIERGALLEAVRPFLRDPERMIATGGTVRVANGCSIRNGAVTAVGLSRSWLVGLQTMEYLRAFYAGRMGLSGLRSLLIISGAFGVFRTEPVRRIGGYSTETITEDLELVVRLHRYYTESNREYRVEFIPDAVVWTEVPESLDVLGRQRDRWYRGLLESLSLHRDMVGRRKYGTVGVFALPFFLFIEALGPLIEGQGYLLVPILFVLGLVNAPFFVLFLTVAIGLGVLMSWLGVFSEVVGFRRYKRPRDIVALLGYGVLENFLFRQWKALISWRGFIQYLRGDVSWGEMTRVGFDHEAAEQVSDMETER